MVNDPIRIILSVAKALDACGIRYLVGGSLASSISGEPRSSMDIDLVVELSISQVDSLTEALKEEFLVDPDVLRRAVEHTSSANILHEETSTKIDLFVLGGTPLDGEQMNRRVRMKVASEPDRYIYTYTPEDILLQKLRWFRLGNEVSERQWRDVLGIVRTQGKKLDDSWLLRGAQALGVQDLLERALREGAG
jgi:hypothetical protein